MQNLDNKWEFSNPNFEYKQLLRDYDSPWVGHNFFVYDLIKNLKPKTIVELGTYKGTSLFAMLQAVKDAGLNSQIFAIDTWQGDEHAGFYGDEIYQAVVAIVRANYVQQAVRLCKKRFEDAVSDFADQSIDLLHIDGFHTYEAVSNDYHTWKNKVKSDGMIMFHDTMVADFGVWKFWEELQAQHPEYYYLNFKHNYGLGVVFKSESIKNYIDFEARNYFEELYLQKAKANLLKEEFAGVKEELQKQCQSLYQSKSWKITAPLRKTASLLR